MQENFYGWIYVTPNRFLNILKFELQYEKTAPQILSVDIVFYNYYIGI